MASLYFRYGVMNSGKSTQLLQIAHDYEVNNHLKVLVLKPSVDTKENDFVVTRMGNGEIKRKCDFLINSNMDLYDKIKNYNNLELILIDEAQFLSRKNVEDLTLIVTKLKIPIICFGLRTSFEGKPFEGSSWLFALAQDIEEITTRAIDRLGKNKKRATMNLRLVNGKPVFKGDIISIDGDNNVSYVPVSLNEYLKLRDSQN